MDDAQLGKAMRRFLVAVMADEDDLDRKDRAAMLSSIVEGQRIVDGGQVGPHKWEIRDHETRELLAQGTTIDDYEQAWQEGWVNFDVLADQVYRSHDGQIDRFGLPESLTDVLQDWIFNNRDAACELIEG